MSTVTWISPAAGSLGVITERVILDPPIRLDATSSDAENTVTFTLLAGSLPRGLRLIDGEISGSPIEVSIYTESRFVIRADDGDDIEDRTFKLAVDGADIPQWITNSGFLNVGPGKAYFVLDNARVDFQLEAYDADGTTGNELEYFLMPQGGELPPGLSLSRDGKITGFTDPIFAFDYKIDTSGGYDVNPFDVTPLDFQQIQNNGYDTYLYDNMLYDYSMPDEMPRRLSRIYTFVVSVSDGLNSTTEVFKIYVVTEEFLQADNSIVKVDTNVFTSDGTSNRVPIWITEAELGRFRANNYVTIFLDVYKPPSLPGTISYLTPTTNPGQYLLSGTDQVVTGHYELSGITPTFKYTPTGPWNDTVNYTVGEAADVQTIQPGNYFVTTQTWVCLRNNINNAPAENNMWTRENVTFSNHTFTPVNTLLWETVIPETTSVFPPGLEFDSVTGQLAGRVPYQSSVTKSYQFTVVAIYYPSIEYIAPYTYRGDWNSTTIYLVNDAVRYNETIYICVSINENKLPSNAIYWVSSISTNEKTFTVDVFGEIDSAIEWLTEADLGTIKPNIPSQLSVEARSLLYGGHVSYSMVGGALPVDLEFLPNGIIQGKVKQFADDAGPGLTRFFDEEDSTRSFDITFDGGLTTFDKIFTFTIRAQDSINFAQADKTFYFTVVAEQDITFVNLSVKAFQPKSKRLLWNNFISDVEIFVPTLMYRYGDPYFSTQSEIKMLVSAGIEQTELGKYVQAMSRNHYRKRILLGNATSAVAKDPTTQEPLYEVVYVEVIDDFEKNGVSISDTIELANNIDSESLISSSRITVDSDIPLVSDEDDQRIFPNSIKNMRSRIADVGEHDRDYLPLWMRSIQPDSRVETGFVKAMVLCYTKPGEAAQILAKIKASGFDFKDLDFEIDRYLIDVWHENIRDKYLAFPQLKEIK